MNVVRMVIFYNNMFKYTAMLGQSIYFRRYGSMPHYMIFHRFKMRKNLVHYVDATITF